MLEHGICPLVLPMDTLDQQLKVGVDILVQSQVSLGGGGIRRADVELATMSPCYRLESFVLHSVLMLAEHREKALQETDKLYWKNVHARWGSEGTCSKSLESRALPDLGAPWSL